MQNLDNKLLEELLALEEELKAKVKRLGELKDWARDKGSFSTDAFVCAIKPRSRVCLVSLDKASEALGREMLEAFNLIQTVEFETVHVSRKTLEELFFV